MERALDAYLARIGHDGPVRADAATLAALHRAHAAAIPFENLDIWLGREIRLEPEHLVGKMVRRRRGGFCFEHNTLFAHMLAEIGFRPRRLLGRATFGLPVLRPRTHMTVLVEADGRPWIADVGFGGHGLIEPVPFEPGAEHPVGDEVYRVSASRDGGWEMEVLRAGAADWLSLYWFDLAVFHDPDFAMACYYVSHEPNSPFVLRRILSLSPAGERRVMRDGELKLTRGGVETDLAVTTEAEYRRVLAGTFGIELADDEALRPLVGLEG
ncbi:MAG TPA: arylamine N-acetyltransferase [Azospirillaceae bacterium]|nr:arylamine N-acetyltransferase [Azospirillaceae bacterium]